MFGHRLACGKERLHSMSEVIPEAQHEFWRPPAILQEAAVVPAVANVCAGCSTEFMVGSRFCHICGVARGIQSGSLNRYWTQLLDFLHIVEFQDLKQWLGLATAPLIAFAIGVFCFLAAILVGVVCSISNFEDFQSVQFWRMEWLLAAIVAMVAGILLKTKAATGK
jgi:hypothetical protein